MDGYGEWHRHLREQPPRWPQRNDDDEGAPEPRRWDREPEAFEDECLPELYPGAIVMDDLIESDDDAGSLRILVRYTAVRLLRLAGSGLRGSQLRLERRIALEHLALLPEHDWERRTLERLVELCRAQPERLLVDAIAVAAEASAKRSHSMGAFSLYRAGYDVALREEWWAEGARVAAGIAMLARMEEARWSTRLWERRAAVLGRRAARETTQ